MINNQHKRILRRRSPPRIVTIEGGRGIANPQSILSPVKINDEVVSKDKSRPIFPHLLNISSIAFVNIIARKQTTLIAKTILNICIKTLLK